MLSRRFDVALSFSGHDREIAYALAGDLAKRRLSVFFDEWFGPGRSDGGDADLPVPEIGLTARVFVPLLSQAYVAGPARSRAFRAALARESAEERGRVLPVRLDSGAIPGGEAGEAAVSCRPECAPELAERIERRVQLESVRSRAVAEAMLPEDRQRHVLRQFVATIPRKPVEIGRYGIVEAMNEAARVPRCEYRTRIAVEVRKHLIAEHDFGLGWPYDIWHDDGAVFLSTLPNFSLPHQTLEFVTDAGRSVWTLKSVWMAPDDQGYGKIDYRLWQPSVAMRTADRVVPCLEREVAIRLLEQAGCGFGFPLTSGEPEAKKFCGWLEQLPPYDYLEWGRDPRLVGGRLGPAQYVLHDSSKIAVYTLLLLGRWSAAAFHALRESLEIHLPNRYRITVPGQGRVRVTVFLADARRQETGRAFLGVRRLFAAVGRMYAALRGLPVLPATGSAALPPLIDELRARFDLVCEDLRDADELPVADRADPGFDSAQLKKLSDTSEGRSLGFSGEAVLDLDSLITHRDIVRFIQRHE
jgi:hypothetical protein